MRALLVRGVCLAVNFLLDDTGSVVTAAQERELALARARDPYVHAFHRRCMQWIYGNDPRRDLHRDRRPGSPEMGAARPTQRLPFTPGP